jgi:four helix bundle protein
MATFTSFEEIKAWQEGRKLTWSIRQICKRARAKHDYSFVDQVTRSTRSITSNIAEGFESMTSAEFISFLGYAKRSAGEVRSHLYDALDEKYVSEKEFFTLTEQLKEIIKMIAGLIQYLQTLDNDRRRTHSKQPN